ncbi:Z-ring formation inhibitor MciZ [Paenibacillus sp. JX-17]|uniref:Z-ring formation inhibitor MciZ n=1 Tax=Paenibacillus lacisoli TaxID=3064525 RepID=A0ABT9C8Z4_9BACL|nr:Z-ring formation inhibitor MciZ [Paenibacillus sp. JX-17]MDO7905139.1 Z-ring formation inhibitor MciZ [Paenibacillus sp. JX-17]
MKVYRSANTFRLVGQAWQVQWMLKQLMKEKGGSHSVHELLLNDSLPQK